MPPRSYPFITYSVWHTNNPFDTVHELNFSDGMAQIAATHFNVHSQRSILSVLNSCEPHNTKSKQSAKNKFNPKHTKRNEPDNNDVN